MESMYMLQYTAFHTWVSFHTHYVIISHETQCITVCAKRQNSKNATSSFHSIQHSTVERLLYVHTYVHVCTYMYIVCFPVPLYSFPSQAHGQLLLPSRAAPFHYTFHSILLLSAPFRCSPLLSAPFHVLAASLLYIKSELHVLKGSVVVCVCACVVV